jgi:hypothetical protein
MKVTTNPDPTSYVRGGSEIRNGDSNLLVS